MLQHMVGFLFSPQSEWKKVDQHEERYAHLLYVPLLALLPALAFYHGITETGWRVAGGDIVRMTSDSAKIIVSLFYMAMIASVVCIGYLVHWMASSYGSQSSIAKGVRVIGYCATPLFISGLVGFYPVLWVNMVAGFLATAASLYLLFVGIPIVMHVPKERGFLFASAILAVCLVIFMALMGVTVMLWEFGFTPVFTD